MEETQLEETTTVELGDTDMARFIHYASVVRYFDIGLRNGLEAADLSFKRLFERGIGLPVVNVECQYLHPMYFGDQLTIQTEVASLSEKTMTLNFSLVNESDTTTAEGSLTMSFYDIDEQRGMKIPPDIRERLTTYTKS